MCTKKRKTKVKIGLKRKLFLTWLAFELASLPFALPTAAMIVKNSIPEELPRVAQVDLPPTPGQSRILLASNGPFVLLSNGASGPMKINLYVTGNINGNVHGGTAQVPGALKTCATPVLNAASIIYRSNGKTADRTGSILDQAVVIEINYVLGQTPKFEIVNLHDEKYKQAVAAQACTI